MGCDYIIIGRDHTGVGDYYEPEGNKRLFESLGECGIKPVYFDSIGFDQKAQKYISMNSSNQLGSISATNFREAILKKETVPDWFVRKQVQELLFSEISMGRSIFHE